MLELSAFLHTPAWERLLQSEGTATERYEGFLYAKHAVPLGGTYWLTARIPVRSDWKIPPFAEKSWFLRLQADDDPSHQALTKSYAKRLHPTPSVQPHQTAYLDLTRSDEELLATMKPKHRYNMRVAEKAGVEVEVIHTHVIESFPRFWNLLRQTADRHDFRTHCEAHYRRIIETHEPEDAVFLAFATHKGEDVAAVMVVTCGMVATYLHGGSSYPHRALMAPNLLHVSVMRYLRTIGITTYDLWGTNAVLTKEGTGYEPIAGHASAGTTRFKLGFGGTILEYPPTIDLVLRPFCYSGYETLRRLRSRKRAFS